MAKWTVITAAVAAVVVFAVVASPTGRSWSPTIVRGDLPDLVWGMAGKYSMLT